VMLQSAAVLEKAYPEDFYKRETYLLYWWFVRSVSKQIFKRYHF
jgi:hypothetical protein